MATWWLCFVLVSGALALAATALFARSALSHDRGVRNSAMEDIARAVRDGAHAFLRRQYRTVGLLAIVVGVGLFVVNCVGKGVAAAIELTVAFAIGAAFSATAGWWAMFVSVRANVRVAEAARESARTALALALRGGAAAALPVVAASLVGIAALFAVFGGIESPLAVPYRIIGFAFGASLVALFAQLGGGIYTKAADIGADLVGKVEKGIPEDDPRNPAVIADLVGDNVGDCAGRGADIFESAAAENIGAMILGVAIYPVFGQSGVLFPLVCGAFGLLASIAGVLLARGEDPMRAITRGHLATLVLAAGGLWITVRWLLADSPWLLLAGLIGLVASFLFALVTRYYTGLRHRPVRWIAKSSVTGPTTNVISGLAVGLESTAVPVLIVCLALFGSYACGVHALPKTHGAGLYGTAIATVGMLSSVGYVLSIDMFGPITDNAGGFVEMAHAEPAIREKTDRLDAVGNTTKATTKGYAIGSAALAAFLLFSAYLEEASIVRVDLVKLPVFLAALIGATVVFCFAGLAIRAVVRDANAVIEEVRRQFDEAPGILTGTDLPAYGRCVDVVTAGALRGMVAPGVLAVAAPVVVGLLLGAEAVAGVLIAGTIAGILLASSMNTGGGAWDNAKKLIETGAYGGKGSPVYKAAVVGDAVGDPLKDTAGPSLHVLIKLLATVALVTAPLFG
jgi:K(+)-stimulated pyrophosphate-energized sodium pump